MKDGRPGRYSALRYGDSLIDSRRLAPTITKIGRLFWDRATELGPESYKAVAGFPSDFRFAGTFGDLKARLGNSVPPPPLMRAVATQVKEEILRSDKLTVVSTFAGCGGSSLGYKMAGYECRLAVEWDTNAVETYRLNFPTTPLYHGDIATLSDAEALRLAGLEPGELDVLDGSPPCQGFSTAGKRQVDDPRNSLFREYVRLLCAFRPRAFVMENVSGMAKGEMKPVFVTILRELKACGYTVRARLLNAAWYGVPQSRERIIFIGARLDLGVDPTHPAPTVKRAVTVGQVLPSLAGQRFLTWRGRGRQDRVTQPGALAPTITKTGGLALAGRRSYMDVEGLKTLTSFPASFLFAGLQRKAVACISNSVPPLLAAAVAREIMDTILT